MTGRYRDRHEARYFMGGIFLIFGTLLLLDNLNFLNIRPTLSHWWPMILVVFGVKQLILMRGSRALIGGLFWIGTGALFLASTLGYVHIAITSVIWPLLLIWFGVLIVLGHNGRCGRRSIQDGSET